MSLITDPLNNLSVLMILGFIVSFFEVSQDIAVDGMAIDILPVDQQARANGLMMGFKNIWNLCVSSCWKLDNEPLWILLCNSIILINCFYNYSCSFITKRKTRRKIMPWTKGEASKVAEKIQLHSWKSIFKSLYKVFFLPVSFMMGIVGFSFSVGRGLIDAVLPVFTVQQLGWQIHNIPKSLQQQILFPVYAECLLVVFLSIILVRLK